MKRCPRISFLGAVIALAVAFAFAVRGDDAPPPPPPAAAAADQPAGPPPAETAKPVAPAPAAPAAAPAVTAAPAESAKAPEVEPPPSPQLRRLDTEGSQTPAENGHKIRSDSRKVSRVRHRATGNEKVSIGHDTRVEKDETSGAAVSIFGSTTVDGEASDAAVSVLGSTTVNGSVSDAAVSVMGDTHVNGSVGDAAVAVGGSVIVNGHVGDAVVAVGGDVKLGPNAVVDGEVVVIGGTLEKDPAAVIRGNVQRVRLPAIGGVFSWAKSALFKGRLLSFAGGASWAWLVALAFLGFYVLLALIFPRAITKCAETIEQRPGFTILTALLAMLATPLVMLLLAITGIGVLVIPFLGLGLFAGKLFGRAAMLAWFGRRFTGWLGEGVFSHIAMAVLVGGIFVMMLYLVPILAFVVLALNGILGLGAVIYTLILSMRRNGTKPAPTPASDTAIAPGGSGAAIVSGPAVTAGDAAMPPVVPAAIPPAAVSVAMLPRAGFWIRLAASLLDFILVLVAALTMHIGSIVLLLLAAYCVVLWALKGTTVGGVICGLKVVRIDDRPVDWSVAIVRVLAAFLSLAVVGLGFIWVAFDAESQSWHDKIAGTTIVRVPKSLSLI